METILIKTDRLKITLTESEMNEYGIDCDRMDYSTTETRSAIWKVLDDARRQTGFDAAKSNVLMEIFKSKGGGCEIFVSREKDKSRELPALRLSSGRTEHHACVFGSVEKLLDACAMLKEASEPCSALVSEENKCYLLLASGSNAEALSDYADKIVPCDGRSLSYIKEHYRLISEDAVKDLAPLR